ncbi:MAG: hypothetical protein IPP81_07340 [Chitinophagaceae bacterium]|nr:hypothetical protein [Chitinophagaceae bacterium]MBL0199983.1 hypothetical protein [Chitinophagaceae bacterium]
MKFDKNKDENKNLDILKKEIKKTKGPYSKILADSLFAASDSDAFRIMIKAKVTQYIDEKIKK